MKTLLCISLLVCACVAYASAIPTGVLTEIAAPSPADESVQVQEPQLGARTRRHGWGGGGWGGGGWGGGGWGGGGWGGGGWGGGGWRGHRGWGGGRRWGGGGWGGGWGGGFGFGR